MDLSRGRWEDLCWTCRRESAWETTARWPRTNGIDTTEGRRPRAEQTHGAIRRAWRKLRSHLAPLRSSAAHWVSIRKNEPLNPTRASWSPPGPKIDSWVIRSFIQGLVWVLNAHAATFQLHLLLLLHQPSVFLFCFLLFLNKNHLGVRDQVNLWPIISKCYLWMISECGEQITYTQISNSSVELYLLLRFYWGFHGRIGAGPQRARAMVLIMHKCPRYSLGFISVLSVCNE